MAQLFGHSNTVKWVHYLLAVLTITLLGGCHPAKTPGTSSKLANHGLLSAVVSPSGKYLFTGSFQHGGALWDLNSNARLFDWNHTTDDYSAYLAADFSDDGRYLAATDGSSVVLWDTQTGEAGLFLESPAQSFGIQNTADIWQTAGDEAGEYWSKPARIIALSLSKQYLLLGLENQVALLINISDQNIIGALAHDEVITHVSMDDAASLAAVGTRDGTVTLWSLDDGNKANELNHASPIAHVALSPNGKQLISAAAKGPVMLNNLSSSAEEISSVELFKGNPGVISSHFAADGTLILGSSRETVWQLDSDQGIIIETWRVPKQGPWHKAAIISIHSRNNDIQAIASDGNSYQLN